MVEIIKGLNIKKSKTIVSLRIRFIIIFVMLSFFTYFLIQFIKDINEKNYLDTVTHTYSSAYSTIYKQKSNLSHLIYTGILDRIKSQYNLELYVNFDEKKKEEIKVDIYNKLLDRFSYLKKHNIKDIQLVLSNNEVLIKMNNFTNKKEFIINKNYSHVKKTKKSYSSYEVTNNIGGFSFYYPIFINNKYFATMKIVFDDSVISSEIMNNYYVISNLILKDDYFNKSYLKKSEIYIKAHHDGFLHNKKVLEELKAFARKDIIQIKPSNETSKRIYINAMKSESMSMFLDDIDLIVTTIPILNKLENKQIGFISMVSKGHTLTSNKENYLILFSLSVILYAAIILVIFINTMKKHQEMQSLKKIIKKDKQLLEQSKLAQMGEMIGNIAHQYRQPLSTISTVASGVKLNYEYNTLEKDKIPENMDLIVNNVKFLSDTIDTFTDFIKENKERKKTIVSERINESLNILGTTLENHGIKLINNINYKKKLKAKIIGQELSQVLINILNNAKDALVQREIKDGFIKISLEEKNDKIFIFIEDNAGGIKDEVLEKIFDPYFTTKHQFKGTGLGLYMSRTIIKKHFDGEIKAENTKEGALFTIKFPNNLKKENNE